MPIRKTVSFFLACIVVAALVQQAFPRSSPQVLDIGSERQLLVDRYLIAESAGLQLKLHSPLPREVMLPMEKPWKKEASCCSVILEDEGKFRLWYRVASRVAAPGEWWNYTAYAESTDGVHWTRPQLNLYDYQGSKKNNLVWMGPGGNMSVLKDRRPEVPEEERYKAVMRTGPGALGLVSPDGLRWKLIQQDPILTGGKFDSHNVIFQDPWTLQFRYYGRGFVKPPSGRTSDLRHGIRRIRTASSADFREWTPLGFVEMPQAPLDHLYTNATTPYQLSRGLYLMFPKRFVPERTFGPSWGDQGQSDIVFASSRDGLHWDRTFLEAFLRPGLDRRNWHERAVIMGQGIVQTGKHELSMYYFENLKTSSCRIRRGTVRLDGFVSVHAPYQKGYFVTPPLVFQGRHFWINYSTSAVGFVRVEIQDEGGQAIHGFEELVCVRKTW